MRRIIGERKEENSRWPRTRPGDTTGDILCRVQHVRSRVMAGSNQIKQGCILVMTRSSSSDVPLTEYHTTYGGNTAQCHTVQCTISRIVLCDGSSEDHLTWRERAWLCTPAFSVLGQSIQGIQHSTWYVSLVAQTYMALTWAFSSFNMRHDQHPGWIDIGYAHAIWSRLCRNMDVDGMTLDDGMAELWYEWRMQHDAFPNNIGYRAMGSIRPLSFHSNRG